VPVRHGGIDDVAFVMATERRPGFEAFVGRWTQEQHITALAAPDYAYLIAIAPDEQPAGFAIIRNIDNAHRNVCLLRIAVAEPSRGFGRPFLRSVTAWAFTQTRAHRFWLDTMIDNVRAQHVYRTSGFRQEGIMREAYGMPDGTRRDLIMFAITRPEWLAANATADGTD